MPIGESEFSEKYWETRARLDEKMSEAARTQAELVCARVNREMMELANSPAWFALRQAPLEGAIPVTTDGLGAEPPPNPIGLPIVSMIEYRGTLFVATQTRLFTLRDGVMVPVLFETQ